MTKREMVGDGDLVVVEKPISEGRSIKEKGAN